MNGTITLPKNEYLKLIEKAFRYEFLHEAMKEDLFSSPPTRDIAEVVDSFKKTKKYNPKFLKSLEKGLKRSFGN